MIDYDELRRLDAAATPPPWDEGFFQFSSNNLNLIVTMRNLFTTLLARDEFLNMSLKDANEKIKQNDEELDIFEFEVEKLESEIIHKNQEIEILNHSILALQEKIDALLSQHKQME
jgi:hypothetical protein